MVRTFSSPSHVPQRQLPGHIYRIVKIQLSQPALYFVPGLSIIDRRVVVQVTPSPRDPAVDPSPTAAFLDGLFGMLAQGQLLTRQLRLFQVAEV